MAINHSRSVQDPAGMVGMYPCPSCRHDTSHTILAIVNSRDFEGEDAIQYLNHYLTVACDGCGTISFCHVSACTEEQQYDEQGRPYLVRTKRHYPDTQSTADQSSENFLEEQRLEQLSALCNDRYDTTRLRQMMAELDLAYRSEAYLSCITLIRAILDHIPPIFGFETFAEVANNYSGGGKSFKQAMQNLETSSRKIADSYLHTRIRAKETVPTKTQIDFRASVDFLFGEIIRNLAEKR